MQTPILSLSDQSPHFSQETKAALAVECAQIASAVAAGGARAGRVVWSAAADEAPALLEVNIVRATAQRDVR